MTKIFYALLWVFLGLTSVRLGLTGALDPAVLLVVSLAAVTLICIPALWSAVSNAREPMPPVFDRNGQFNQVEVIMSTLRVYALIWIFVLAAAGGLFYTGSFNDVTLPIFGFVSATLFFAGFVAVLPAWMVHYFAPRTYSPARLERISKRRQAAKAPKTRNIQGG